MHFGKYGHEQLAKLFVGKVVPKKKKSNVHVGNKLKEGSTKGNLYLSLFSNHPPKEKLIPCIKIIQFPSICKF